MYMGLGNKSESEITPPRAGFHKVNTLRPRRRALMMNKVWNPRALRACPLAVSVYSGPNLNDSGRPSCFL